MTTVIGIDQSLTRTGVAVHVPRTGQLEVHSFETKRGNGSNYDLRGRIRYIVGSILRVSNVDVDGPVLSVIEHMYLPQTDKQRAGAVLERAGLFWMITDQMLGRGPVVEVSPGTRAKYATDSGSSDKTAVLNANQWLFPTLGIRNDDEADALTLARMGARFLGSPIDGDPSKAQLEAMNAVRWPNPKEIP